MKLLLKLIGYLGGSMLVGLIVLVLIGVVVFFVVKKRFLGFVTKAAVAANPPHLHLVRELSPAWDDYDEVKQRVDALRALGFRALGTYGCQELDDFQLVAMAHPKEGWAASVYEHPENGHWVDLATQFRDTGEYLVVSSAPDGGKLPKVPGFLKHFDKKADVPKLHKTFVKQLGHHLVVPAGPDNFVSFFETYYAEEMQGLYDVLDIEPDVPAAQQVDRDPALDEACAPLFRAVAHRDPAQVQQQVQTLRAAGSSLEGRDDDGKTPLMAAVLSGDPALVDPLITAGAELEATVPGDASRPFQRQRSMAEMAADHGDPEDAAAAATIGRVLGALGTGSAGGNDTLTPLILAVWTGHEQIASALIQAGASAEGHGEPRPLHYATERGDIHMVNLLLRSGVDLELRDDTGRTALMVAVQEEDVELVQWLLEAGADVDAKDEDGDTALSVAGENGSEDLFELLVPRAKKNIRKARKYLAESADPDRRPEAERLLRAASDGALPRLQRLLGHLPADTPNADDWTPLIAAADSGRLDSVRLLLDAGANVNYRSKMGYTALSQAVQTPFVDPRYQADLVQMLIDAGASLDALDPEVRPHAVKLLQSRGRVLPA